MMEHGIMSIGRFQLTIQVLKVHEQQKASMPVRRRVGSLMKLYNIDITCNYMHIVT